MNNPVLELSDIHKSYGALHILRGANLRLNAGEVVGLIAPSGAGKSTLLHIAGLLDRPSGGNLSISGQDFTTAGDKARTAARGHSVGFIYQFHHLLPEFTARDNIILPQLAVGQSPKAARARADDLLAKVGLADRAGHRPAALSGGEQQRVAFCRALANNPALLLADEPTGNLDPATSAQVFDVLMQIVRATGLSALIATHNMDLAAQMDRVVTLKDGQLV
jgi:lipoprotein-releasing system ATP-binding protein